MFTLKNYVRVTSLEEAYELNQKKTNKIIGGMMWMKMGSRNLQAAIDLSDLGLNQIEENENEFRIGAMCTLRQLEINDELNNFYKGAFKEALKHIVGVQFRNGATIGGSIYGRYGFSDPLTLMLALNTYVELYKGGLISLNNFIRMPYDNDILVRIIIKKDIQNVMYQSVRNSATDFPVLTCAVSKDKSNLRCVVGARPSKAKLTILNALELDKETIVDKVIENTNFQSNLRGSKEYREQLAKVLVRRGVEAVVGGNNGN